MPLLDKKMLLMKEALKTQKVDLGNDEFVYVRQMTGRERDKFEQSLIKETSDKKGYERSTEDFRAKLAVLVLCDENGVNLLNPNDYGTLSQNMSAARLSKIADVAQELNKMTEEDKEALIKNSDADLVGSSSSVSAEK